MPTKRSDRSAQRATWKASGLCPQCGGARTAPIRPGRPTLLCQKCLSRTRAATEKFRLSHRQERRVKGLCGDCGKVETGGAYCDPCREKRRHRYHTRYREARIAAHKVAHRTLKQAVFEAYGGAHCACCGETHQEFLSVDHAKGDGAAHRKSIGWVSGNIYGWLKKNGFPEGFRILCMNCNFALGHVGYCPHQRERENAS